MNILSPKAICINYPQDQWPKLIQKISRLNLETMTIYKTAIKDRHAKMNSEFVERNMKKIVQEFKKMDVVMMAGTYKFKNQDGQFCYWNHRIPEYVYQMDYDTMKQINHCKIDLGLKNYRVDELAALGDKIVDIYLGNEDLIKMLSDSLMPECDNLHLSLFNEYYHKLSNLQVMEMADNFIIIMLEGKTVVWHEWYLPMVQHFNFSEQYQECLHEGFINFRELANE